MLIMVIMGLDKYQVDIRKRANPLKIYRILHLCNKALRSY